MRQRSARILKLLVMGSVIILVTGLGFVIGSFVGMSHLMVSEMDLPDWQPLDDPPEAVAHLVGIDYDTATLYIQSESEHYYACCWQLVDQPPVPSEALGQCSPSKTPSPPGEVLEQITHVECGGEWFIQYSYALLSDGSIWQWHFTPNAYEGIRFLAQGLLYPVCGTASGLGIGIFLASLPWLWRLIAARKS
jgi:hypothetical protein